MVTVTMRMRRDRVRVCRDVYGFTTRHYFAILLSTIRIRCGRRRQLPISAINARADTAHLPSTTPATF